MAGKEGTSSRKAGGPTTAERAYQIWESEGRPHGRDVQHWLQAEAEQSTGRSRKPAGKTAT
jgi:hypothetical protein